MYTKMATNWTAELIEHLISSSMFVTYIRELVVSRVHYSEVRL